MRASVLTTSPTTSSRAPQPAWHAHLEKLGIAALKVNPDAVLIATEGALWGSVAFPSSVGRSRRGPRHPGRDRDEATIRPCAMTTR
jgi:hypothetical protein